MGKYDVVSHACTWRSVDLPNGKEDLVISLGPCHVDVFDRAVKQWASRGLTFSEMTRDSFNLDEIGSDIQAWLRLLQNGRGALILRGFPVGRWTVDQTTAAFLGLGLHFGRPITQSVMGDLVGHVIDMTREKPDARSYQSNRELVFHNDFCDILGLLSVRSAVSGGLSRICSGAAIHNELVRTSPQLLAPLYSGFRVHLMDEQKAGAPPVTPFKVPVFSFASDLLSVLFVRVLYAKAAALTGDSLVPQELEALQRVSEIADAEDFMLEFMLDPGEALFVNNLLMLHSRTAIENPPDAPRRHLLRLWLNVPSGRPRIRELDIYETNGGIQRDDSRQPAYAQDELHRAVRGHTR